MRQFYQFVLVIVLTITTGFASANLFLETEQDSVFLSAGYTNDIYYSFENGEIASIERANWDIGFYTNVFSAGIITNDGKGVELYTYPTGDTSAWNTIDTSGLFPLPILYNSTDQWEEGAFNRYSSGDFDYGWGVYNVISHQVIGDSIYIIKLGDDDFKKLWIEKKASMQNIYYFKFANLDGSNEVNVELNCNDFFDKNFVYYSLSDEAILDREPSSDSWDILFTKYIAILQGGVPYGVTGVLNNVNIPANRFNEVGPNFEDWTSTPMDSTKNPIGYDWKYFDMNSTPPAYVVEDSTAFFVRNLQKDVFKLVFSVFDYTDGKVVFSKNKIHTSGIGNQRIENSILVYPNPASDVIQIGLSGDEKWETILITDLSGKIVYSQELFSNEIITISIDQLNSGLYLITTKSENGIDVQKLIVR